ncbi:MAG: VWA domain-containing protein [Bryobacteraceae bacterium]|nr:VWA domain-containing protein [Bryobacteraceae bacterium]
MTRLILLALLAAAAAYPSMRIIVTVVEPRTGKPVEDLKAEDFLVLEDKLTRRVEASEFGRHPIDVMLLVDTSLVGGTVQPVAQGLIGELKEKEQMAIVAFDSSAEMIQDFTASRQLLGDALNKVKYGNTPRVLDALFAAMDGGFEHATFRKVMMLVTTGLEGDSRQRERDVIRMARRNGVSIYPVYATGAERGMFEELARRTGGASFSLRDLQKSGANVPSRIFDVVRAHYTVTIAGNLGLGEKLKVEIKGREKQKLRVSALPID